ncbi:leucine-rich repeat domain-containing protein [Pseudobutyrivibrio xylanivorans]|uniref:Leucine rich repeat-containing protein n=1 Tax=Pseudobutyrivibrio xylanivorans DSM 14809 TaxID=1123012 RepID=A0A1M6KFR1_PSEXY|nr:leucine-rich repeat domain-containing protein [Pseudobutyrivibrio xylanivorans]SHJ57692.1 Leucine rich repeat-containing protein [Pseudobutyrivibrio xylanivorans DSM 14809]
MKKRYIKCLALALCTAMLFESQVMPVFASPSNYEEQSTVLDFSEEESDEVETEPEVKNVEEPQISVEDDIAEEDSSDAEIIDESEVEEVQDSEEDILEDAEEEETEDFEISDGKLIKYEGNKEYVEIPYGVESIGAYAFAYCDSLTEVVIPDSVKEISEFAFFKCGTIGEVRLPNGLKTLNGGVFGGCTINTVTVPKTIEEVTFAFSNFSDVWGAFTKANIENLIFEDGTTSINTVMFLDGSTVKHIYIPESVENITPYDIDEEDQGLIGIPKGATIHGKNGSYAHKFAQEKDYEFVATEGSSTISINADEITISDIDDVEYNFGDEVKPVPVVKDGDKELVEGQHYTLEYSSNIDAGTGYVTVTGIPENGYEGSKELSFNITPYDISQDKSNRVIVTCDKYAEFDKTGAKPNVVVSIKNSDGTTQELSQLLNYVVGYENNTKFNGKEQPYAVIQGTNNFTGSVERQFTIKERDISKASMFAGDRICLGLPNSYATLVFLYDSHNMLRLGQDVENIQYTYYDKTVVKVSGKKVTRKAGEAVGNKDVIPANTIIKVTATAKKGSGYTGTVSTAYTLIPIRTVISKFLSHKF